MSSGFHIRHNAKPEVVKDILEIMHYKGELKKENIIKLLLPQYSKSVIEESMIIKNKIVDDSEIEYLLKMDKITFNNYLHYKLYISNLPIGWSYRNIIEVLYNEYNKRKINYLDIAQKIKERAYNSGWESIAFDKTSVVGALNFISALEPKPVNEKNIFQRRDYCQPHLMLWAIDYIYRKQWNGEYGSLMLLDDEKINEICKLCLIDKDNFDVILKQTTLVYNFLEVSIKLFGTYIRVMRKWRFEDIL